MPWNYRVIRTEHDNGSVSHLIHECYYADRVPPDGIPHARTTEPITPYGDSLDDLRADLEAMLRAFDKPVLQADGDRLIPAAP